MRYTRIQFTVFKTSNNKMSDEDYVSPELLKTAKDATDNTLPNKSYKPIYEKCYNDFIEWKKEKKTKSFDEEVMLAYFLELSNAFNSATLWSKYSMLKIMLYKEKNINIKSYNKLRSFLKRQHTNYKPKKAKVFSSNDIDKFLTEAPDDTYLVTKVALILGITGACRRDELYNMTINDFEIVNSLAIVKIPHTKAHISRTFIIEGKYFEFIKKYIEARPNTNEANTNKFFLNYHKNKCNNQVVGINTLGKVPQIIASFLQLPDAALYTGHSFRRTSMTLLADSGANEIYKSTWFAFDSLKFLLNKNTPCQMKDNTIIYKKTKNEEAVVNDLDWNIEKNTESTSDPKIQASSLIQRKRKSTTIEDRHLCKTFDILETSSHQAVQDDCQHFGNLVAIKLRKFNEDVRTNLENDIMGLFVKANRGFYNLPCNYLQEQVPTAYQTSHSTSETNHLSSQSQRE